MAREMQQALYKMGFPLTKKTIMKVGCYSKLINVSILLCLILSSFILVDSNFYRMIFK